MRTRARGLSLAARAFQNRSRTELGCTPPHDA
jgi:hypothetical protein